MGYDIVVYDGILWDIIVYCGALCPWVLLILPLHLGRSSTLKSSLENFWGRPRTHLRQNLTSLKGDIRGEYIEDYNKGC